MLEQCRIQPFYGFSVGKVYGIVAVGIGAYKGRQFRTALYKQTEVIPFTVAVAGVQFQLLFGVLAFGFALCLGLYLRWFHALLFGAISWVASHKGRLHLSSNFYNLPYNLIFPEKSLNKITLKSVSWKVFAIMSVVVVSLHWLAI